MVKKILLPILLLLFSGCAFLQPMGASEPAQSFENALKNLDDAIQTNSPVAWTAFGFSLLACLGLVRKRFSENAFQSSAIAERESKPKNEPGNTIDDWRVS